jgi:hypothetical protein
VTKRVGTEVALSTCIWVVLSSNLGWVIGYPELFRDFPQVLQENCVIVYRLGHGCFLPNSFQFIIPLIIEGYNVATETVDKQHII